MFALKTLVEFPARLAEILVILRFLGGVEIAIPPWALLVTMPRANFLHLLGEVAVRLDHQHEKPGKPRHRHRLAQSLDDLAKANHIAIAADAHHVAARRL